MRSYSHFSWIQSHSTTSKFKAPESGSILYVFLFPVLFKLDLTTYEGTPALVRIMPSPAQGMSSTIFWTFRGRAQLGLRLPRKPLPV